MTMIANQAALIIGLIFVVLAATFNRGELPIVLGIRQSRRACFCVESLFPERIDLFVK